jgi:hypothetical protein
MIAFQRTIESPWTELEPIRVGRIPPGIGTPDVFVIAEVNSRIRLRVDVYGGNECYVFQEAEIWNNWLVIGFGETLHLVPLNGDLPITIDLESYFGHLYLHERILLVATASHLYCINRDGTIEWVSGELGIDGVVVRGIEDGQIHGEGEWDPPDGWKPFLLQLSSGSPLRNRQCP